MQDSSHPALLARVRGDGQQADCRRGGRQGDNEDADFLAAGVSRNGRPMSTVSTVVALMPWPNPVATANTVRWLIIVQVAEAEGSAPEVFEPPVDGLGGAVHIAYRK